MYNRQIRLTQLLAKTSAANRQATTASLAESLGQLKAMLDCQHALVAQHNWMLMTIIKLGASHAVDLIAAILHKNFFLVHGAMEHSSNGLFGPARVLLRPIYEGLLLAKYCAVIEDTALMDQWIAGKQVNISTSVLKRIAKPDNAAMNQFWRVLCQYSHATVYSQQSGETFDRDEVKETFGLITMLLNMNGHLLKRYFITRSMSYYAERYGNLTTVQFEQRRLRLLMDASVRILNPEGRAVVNGYRATWTLATA